MNLMLRWTNTELPLMFRDDVISLAGPYPFRGAGTDRRKRKRFPGQKYPPSARHLPGFFTSAARVHVYAA
ncbi:hypothetical protein [Pantoea ananatis]|uniref:hypothetical protein n=1 Tax=Pantoea ananas TaxID=553 RepID=UPI000AB7684A|nr:hypothetical protein [Pantoea ananatis]